MQDSSHLTIILYSSVKKLQLCSQKQKFNRKIIIIIIHVLNYNFFFIIHVFQENNNKTPQDCTENFQTDT
jgi:hypothetical protein